MKINKTVGVVFRGIEAWLNARPFPAICSMILFIAAIFGWIATRQNPSANESFASGSRMFEVQTGKKMTPEMLEEGKLLLSKFPNKDHRPYLYERVQPWIVFNSWWLKSKMSAQGETGRDGFKYLQAHVAEVVSSN